MSPFVRCALVSAVAGLVIFAAFAWSPPTDTNFVLESFDVFNDGDVLLMPIELNGQRYSFALDTGAATSVYDATLVPQLGKLRQMVKAQTPNGEMEIKLCDSPKASLGRLSLPTNVPMAVLDLKKARQGCGHDMYGILGMDFLKNHIVRIDLDLGKVQFLRTLDPDPGVSMDLSFDRSNRPMVDFCPAKGVAPFACVIDTGDVQLGSGSFPAEMLGALADKKKAAKVGELLSHTLNSVKSESLYRVDSLTLGDFTHRGLYISTNQNGQEFGLSYWRRYIVTFDFPQHKMYLKKSKQYDTVDFRDRSGLHILRVDGCVVVEAVDKGSLADAARIKPGDVLLQISDTPTEKERLHVLRRLLCEGGGNRYDLATARRHGTVGENETCRRRFPVDEPNG